MRILPMAPRLAERVLGQTVLAMGLYEATVMDAMGSNGNEASIAGESEGIGSVHASVSE